MTKVDSGAEAQETDELLPRWVSKDNPHLTHNMPPDASIWWPIVSSADVPETVTHIIYEPRGDLKVITKIPDIAQMQGEILGSAAIAANNL